MPSDYTQTNTDLHCERLVDRSICGVISAILYMAGVIDYLSTNGGYLYR
jgi:hypothetical protein